MTLLAFSFLSFFFPFFFLSFPFLFSFFSFFLFSSFLFRIVFTHCPFQEIHLDTSSLGSSYILFNTLICHIKPLQSSNNLKDIFLFTFFYICSSQPFLTRGLHYMLRGIFHHSNGCSNVHWCCTFKAHDNV